MAGIFGVVSIENCIKDLFLGTFYLQHRAQTYCGLSFFNENNLENHTHRGLLKEQFPEKRLEQFKSNYGIGSVSVTREPVSEISRLGGMILSFDGNIINNEKLKNDFLKKGISFSGYHNPEEVNDSVLISNIISRGGSFISGVESLFELIQGDFSLISLTRDGIYAARGWGRKPLILGKREDCYAVSSESNSFINTGFEITRDVNPGEIVFIDKTGVSQVKQFKIDNIKYGTFEWIYTSHPGSIIDGRGVADVRMKIGKALARRYPIEADIVSPIPNSGRWHAIGYSQESGIPYREVFIRYDYSDRSYTQEECLQQKTANEKLIPLKTIIRDKKIIINDDSIVRGKQTKKQTLRLKELGAREVHGRISCPPLMSACKYGKSTKKDEDCIARRMSIEEIRNTRGFDSLGYATIDDLVEAIGFSKDKLCLSCWES